MYYNKTIAAVIPAYNEQASITSVISELKALCGPDSRALFDDIVVCDNASTDTTATLATRAGARVVYEKQKGYGIACQAAIAKLNNPDIVVFIDADHSVLADEVLRLLAPLRKGVDLVIGSRVLGTREPRALTPPQRIGNWLASHIISQLWCYKVSDLGSRVPRTRAGARVVYEKQKGYGIACQAAIAKLNNPDIVVFIDADHSVLADEVLRLLAPLRKGVDLVIGSRVLGTREPRALTPPQRIGNWLASHIISQLWCYKVSDLGPFRAICYQSLKRLQMQDERYGWTVEMQVKAIQYNMIVAEVPVTSLKRIGKSKISGTVKGCVGAALGIFGTIFKLYSQEKHSPINSTSRNNP